MWLGAGVSAVRWPACLPGQICYLLFTHKHLLTQMGHQVDLSVAQRGKCDRVHRGVQLGDVQPVGQRRGFYLLFSCFGTNLASSC